MKFNLSKLYLPILAIAIFGQCNVWANPELENKVADSFEEFVDLNKNPHKKWEYYVSHWVKILHADPKYREFCALLSNLKQSQNYRHIACKLEYFFNRNKNLIPQSLIGKLEKYKDVLLKVLEKRVGGNGR